MFSISVSKEPDSVFAQYVSPASQERIFSILPILVFVIKIPVSKDTSLKQYVGLG